MNHSIVQVLIHSSCYPLSTDWKIWRKSRV